MTLQERLMSELRPKISKLAAAYQSDSMEFDYSVLEIPEKDLTTFIEEELIHTIEQTIKEGYELVKTTEWEATVDSWRMSPDYDMLDYDRIRIDDIKAFIHQELQKAADQLSQERTGFLDHIAKLEKTHQQELQKAREEIIREVNSFSARYPEYGVRLYQWEDGTLGMDTITFQDAVNNIQGEFRTYLYKEDQSELDQPTDGMPHPFANPEGVYRTNN